MGGRIGTNSEKYCIWRVFDRMRAGALTFENVCQ
jgi:hypothetical protein